MFLLYLFYKLIFFSVIICIKLYLKLYLRMISFYFYINFIGNYELIFSGHNSIYLPNPSRSKHLMIKYLHRFPVNSLLQSSNLYVRPTGIDRFVSKMFWSKIQISWLNVYSIIFTPFTLWKTFVFNIILIFITQSLYKKTFFFINNHL